MQVFLTKTMEVTVLADVTCDVCGKSCISRNSINPEYARLCAEWGYDSGKDGTKWDCDMCETCADNIRRYIESIGGTVRLLQYD